jgi:hypothetical protein
MKNNDSAPKISSGYSNDDIIKIAYNVFN